MSTQYPSFTRGLKGFAKFNVVFETVTGLLIRMPVSAQAYRIGGADQYPMVVRKVYGDRELEVPYVPGSSIKGRMRGLLELSLMLPLYTTDGKIWQHARNLSAMGREFFNDVLERCVVDELFGWSAANYSQLLDKARKLGLSESQVRSVYELLAPTRLLFSDFFPTREYVERIGARSITDFLEEKSENRIDRITSAADPRSIVRVKPGVEFEGTITLLFFDHDRDMVLKYLTTLATGLKLVEETYLGASGSRGYGRVKFKRIFVNVFRVARQGNVPKLEDVGVKREFSSVDELLKNVEPLAREIIGKLYS